MNIEWGTFLLLFSEVCLPSTTLNISLHYQRLILYGETTFKTNDSLHLTHDAIPYIVKVVGSPSLIRTVTCLGILTHVTTLNGK